MLTVLMAVLASNVVDRAALGLVLQDIKEDLSLTDTQLGLLTGLAFALFYSVMGIPIARWADRGNRVTIIALTTGLWSTAVALCGTASSFIHLLVLRISVAVGEAGCIPPAHSLIADHFSRAERPRAVAVYMLGAPLSVVIGYFVAGWLNEFYGWRVMFAMLGIPGVVLALVAWLTLREPRRETAIDKSARPPAVAPPPIRSSDSVAGSSGEPSVKEVCVTLWANRTFRHLLICFSVTSFFAYGLGQWQPAFLIRTFGLTTGELGSWLTLIYGLGGVLGTYWGGELASRRAANDERLQLRGMAVVFCCLAVISACIYLVSNQYWAFALMAVTAVGGTIVSGPLFATIQTLVPMRMRAMSIALIYLFANLVGMGLGPLAAGALSDGLRPLYGDDSLRYALFALSPGYLWGAWHLWRGSRTVARDVESSNLADHSSAARVAQPEFHTTGDVTARTAPSR